ncbi:hypothetical protein, partial [Candidatus Darwinibacter acetoxidans]
LAAAQYNEHDREKINEVHWGRAAIPRPSAVIGKMMFRKRYDISKGGLPGGCMPAVVFWTDKSGRKGNSNGNWWS